MSAPAVSDRFAGVFGQRRGADNAPRLAEPRCPLSASEECCAIAIGERGDSWRVGWYGSELTLNITFGEHGGVLRVRHYHPQRSGTPWRLRRSRGASTRLPWAALPEDVQRLAAQEAACILEECGRGVREPVRFSSGSRPLDPEALF